MILPQSHRPQLNLDLSLVKFPIIRFPQNIQLLNRLVYNTDIYSIIVSSADDPQFSLWKPLLPQWLIIHPSFIVETIFKDDSF